MNCLAHLEQVFLDIELGFFLVLFFLCVFFEMFSIQCCEWLAENIWIFLCLYRTFSYYFSFFSGFFRLSGFIIEFTSLFTLIYFTLFYVIVDICIYIFRE